MMSPEMVCKAIKENKVLHIVAVPRRSIIGIDEVYYHVFLYLYACFFAFIIMLPLTIKKIVGEKNGC